MRKITQLSNMSGDPFSKQGFPASGLIKLSKSDNPVIRNVDDPGEGERNLELGGGGGGARRLDKKRRINRATK